MRTDTAPLQATLIGILGRMISVEEMRDALGLAASTYYEQSKEGRLICAENLRTAARNLGINEVQLLVACGVIDRAAVDEYVHHNGNPPIAAQKRATSAKGRRSRKPLADAPDL